MNEYKIKFEFEEANHKMTIKADNILHAISIVKTHCPIAEITKIKRL